MSRSVAELVTKLTSTGRTITSAKTLALKAMAEHTKSSILSEARDIAPDLNLSGVGTKGAKIGVRYTVSSRQATVRATGPWQFIEFNTRPHVIASKGLRGTRRSKAAAVQAGRSLRLRANADTTRLNLNGSYRFYVTHPGTKGQRPFQNGVSKALPRLPTIAAGVYRQQIARVFR